MIYLLVSHPVKMQTTQQIRVFVKQEPVWMNEQGPADRGRS